MKLNHIFGGAAAAMLITGAVAFAQPSALAQTAAAPTATTPAVPAAPAVVAAPAATQQREGLGQMLKTLDLTLAEKAELKALMKSNRTQMEAVKSNTTLTDQQRHQQMRQIRESTMSQLRADLTPAQQQSLDAMIAQQKAERRAARAETTQQP